MQTLQADGSLKPLPASSEVSRREDGRKMMILGGGPNRIGQGIEFDYCCCHASFAGQDQGIATVMVNSNPETVSTDYDTRGGPIRWTNAFETRDSSAALAGQR